MIKKFQIITDRPPFVKVVDYDNSIIVDGYTLQINYVDQSVSIIKSKKGGRKSMLKTVTKALEGFEKQFNELNEMKANLENDKEVAKQEALAKVEEKFALYAQRIDNALKPVSETIEIEVPDEEIIDEATEEDGEVAE